MKIYYQNNQDSAAFDITTLVSDAVWTTKRSGAPASLCLSVLSSSDIHWQHGGIVTMTGEGGNLFYGYVVSFSQSEQGDVTVTSYDQLWYLKKNKDTYVFSGRRADEILSQIALDFGLTCGELANTGYQIPLMVEDGQTLLDMILTALELTLVSTGKQFVLWDDFGRLCLTSGEDWQLDLILGDDSLVTGYTYTSDIDADTYNKVKLVQNNKSTGKRDVYLFQDEANIALWGALQNYQVVKAELNSGQIKEQGARLLALSNTPKQTFQLSALSEISVRGGCSVYIGLKQLGISQFFTVEEVCHNLLQGTMNLSLKEGVYGTA